VEFEQTFTFLSGRKLYMVLLSKKESSDQKFVKHFPKSCK